MKHDEGCTNKGHGQFEPGAKPQHRKLDMSLQLFIGVAAASIISTASAETWRGFTVAPEHRRSPY